jgi:hypothetical protein
MAEEISPLEDCGWWMERLRKDAKANRHKALFLADVIKADPASKTHHDEAAAELCRLHALNGELLEALKSARPYVSAALAETGSADAYRAECQVDIAIAKATGEQR